jgi:uncharacterized delta-60 repeat protein
MKKTTFLSLLLLFISFNLFSQAGSLDETFGTNGVTITHLSPEKWSDEEIEDIAIQPDGKIVTTGYTEYLNYKHVVVARYKTDGSLDSSFGNNGIDTIPSPPDRDRIGGSVILQHDGKIVIGISEYNNRDNPDFVLARLLADGTLDKSFGDSGIVITDIGHYENNSGSVFIQSDGKITAVGVTTLSAVTSFITFVRYNVDGSLDETFGTGGIVNFGKRGDYPFFGVTAEVTSAGEIIAASRYKSLFEDRGKIIVLKFKNNGDLDSTFGSNGISSLKTYELTSVGVGPLKLTADNKILLLANAMRDLKNEFLLIRLNADGSSDNSFGHNGFVETKVDDYLYGDDMDVQPDGKIITVGSAYNDSNQRLNGLARYMPDGFIDSTFGKNGFTFFSTSNNSINTHTVAIQNDGKIVMGGSIYPKEKYNLNFILARVNGDNNFAISSQNEKNNAAIVNKKISLFPNPTSNILTITGLDLHAPTTISIIDNDGKVISKTISANQSNYTVNVSNLKSGMYFLQLTENGKTTTVLKFLKQ